MATFDEVVNSNRRDSILLLVLLLLILGGLGAAGSELLLGASPLIGAVVVVVCSSVYFLFMWFLGDSCLLYSLGAEEADRDACPVLYNVVEELCIASALPMPRVYVLNEESLNACATGRDPAHASVAVTNGLLNKLNRDELAAVVAHELSHVKNFDIRFSTLLAVTVGAVLLVRDVILNSLFYMPGSRRTSSDRRDRDSRSAVVFYAVLLIFVVVSPIFTLILQAMASRSREYMADADGVKLTRNPDALISTLKKISAESGAIENSATSGTSHIFFVSPKENSFFGSDSLFSTHPSIQERVDSIRRIYAVAAAD